MHILASAHQRTKPSRWGVNAAAKCGRLMEHWIRLHWFELSALVLLGLNLLFVIKVLSVLRAVQDGLILLARWLDMLETRSIVSLVPETVLASARGLTFAPSC